MRQECYADRTGAGICHFARRWSSDLFAAKTGWLHLQLDDSLALGSCQILSKEALYARTNRLFGGFDKELTPLKGILQNLLSSQYVVDVVAEHQLKDINKYPLLVYPEWETITPDFKKILLDYVSKGGKLLLIGPNSSLLFKDELKVSVQTPATVKNNGLEYQQWIAELKRRDCCNAS